MGPEEDDLGSWIGEGETREKDKRAKSQHAQTRGPLLLLSSLEWEGHTLSGITALCTPTVPVLQHLQTRNHPRPDENDTMPTPCPH